MPLKHVTLILNSLEPETWERYEVEDLCAFLVEKFEGVFPDTARIYHTSVCVGNDITPGGESVDQDVKRLQEHEGPFFVVVYPAGFLGLLVVLALAVYAYTLIPTPPSVKPLPNALARNTQSSSPNNELSDRANRARINGRIPDIYGTVRSTPDLISAPYKIFENGREVEYAYMCIGRGPYEVEDVRDGETLVENIPGSSVMVYGPYTSPNSYDPNNPGVGDPELTIGELIRVPVLSTKRSNSVNGQVLRPPNDVHFPPPAAVSQLRFVYPNRIEMPTGDPNDFTKYFFDGDVIVLSNATMDGVTPVTVHLPFKAANADVVYSYPGGTKTFDCGNGALLFPASQADLLATIFSGTFSITTGSVTNIGDISGTYTVAGTPVVDGPDNAEQQAAGIPSYFIVQLVNPETVNANWDDVDWSGLINFSSDFTYTVSPFNIDLDGTYTVISVTKGVMLLDDPSTVAADWEDVLSIELVTPFLNAEIDSSGPKWVGPFILADPNLTEVYCNFVAQNGLYKDDGTDQTEAEIEVELEITPVDLDDLPIDDPELFQVTLVGSPTLKETVAETLKAHPTFFGRTSMRARRITEKDDAFVGQVVDEVRWRDAYSVAPVDKTDFGNITTVMSITLATASALAVKERKLNMLVSRKIPTWSGTELLDTVLAVSDDVPLVLAAICRDKYIGNRLLVELDIAQWFEVAEAAETYFGIDVVRKFSYTFDNDNVSFEEMATTVVQAMFCVAYRRGSTIRLSFEELTADSTLLFNHRNKLPGTEKRTITFGGFSGDNDGVQYTYVNPNDNDAITTIFLPEDYAAINPKRVESIGVRDPLQAYFHAWRVWNRIQYQNTTVEFDATQEADLLVVNDRILVTDGTRPQVQEGEVVAIDGLELTLSQSVDVATDPPYTIFLQHYDGTVESIGVTAGTDSNQVVLDDAPALDLSVDPKYFARATFWLTSAGDQTQTAFLVAERSPTDRNMISTVRAINYDARYYDNDSDFINEIIDEDGYGEQGGYTPPEEGDTGYLPPEETADFNTALACESVNGNNFTAPASWAFGASNFTVAFWHKSLGAVDGASFVVLRARSDAGAQSGYEVAIIRPGGGGTLTPRILLRPSTTSFTFDGPPQSIADDVWHHWAFSVDWGANTVEYILDGVSLGTDDITTGAGSVGTSGTNRSILFNTNAAIDELLVFTVAKTPSEIAALMGQPIEDPLTEPDLLACWHFDDGGGSVTTDSVEAIQATLRAPGGGTAGHSFIDGPPVL